VMHPSSITAHHIVRRGSDGRVKPLAQAMLTQLADSALLQGDLSKLPIIYQQTWPHASAESFTLQA
jgi:hypothetical protein